MAKILALAGAHRVGKTTIGRQVADMAMSLGEFTAKFVPASLGDACARMGIDPAETNLPFDQRIKNQNNLIQYFAGRVQEMLNMDCDFVVTDRSPWDFYAYTVLNAGNAGRDLTTEQQDEVFKFELFCKHFEPFFYHIAVVQPGIPVVPEPLKAELNAVYMSALNDIIVGKITETQININTYKEQIGLRLVLPAEMTDQDTRVGFIYKVLQASQFTHH